MTRTLVIETAAAACSVALLDGDEVIAAAHEIVGRGHAERLVPMIADLPDAGRADRVLVDCGPGSFTGVRVGVAAARALGFAWGARVSGFSAPALLAAMAVRRRPGLDRVTVAMIGGHGEYFVQRFLDGDAPEPVHSLDPGAAMDAAGTDWIVGSAAPALLALRGDGFGLDLLPDAACAALLAEALRALPATPIYVRAPDARLPAAA